jgi:hypothetical protein
MNLFIKTKDLYEEEFYNEADFLKNLISEELERRLENDKITSFLVKTELTNAEKFEIEKLNLEGVYTIGENLYFNPEKIINREKVAKEISNLLKLDYDKIFDKTKRRQKRYLPLLKNMRYSLYNKIKNFTKEEKDLLKK